MAIAEKGNGANFEERVRDMEIVKTLQYGGGERRDSVDQMIRVKLSHVQTRFGFHFSSEILILYSPSR